MSPETQRKENGQPGGEAGPVRVDFAFRRELAEKVEGNLASFCYQCGACVGDCPATTFGHGFNPREVMLKVLYGLEKELIREDSIVWHCTNCYACHERCPQEVKPVEVIISIKNMLADRGILPETVKKVIGTFEETGRTVPMSPAIDKTRARFGLKPLGKVPVEEIRELIRPEAGEEHEVAPDMEAAKDTAGEPDRGTGHQPHTAGKGERRKGDPSRKTRVGKELSSAAPDAAVDPSEEETAPLPAAAPGRRK